MYLINARNMEHVKISNSDL